MLQQQIINIGRLFAGINVVRTTKTGRFTILPLLHVRCKEPTGTISRCAPIRCAAMHESLVTNFYRQRRKTVKPYCKLSNILVFHASDTVASSRPRRDALAIREFWLGIEKAGGIFLRVTAFSFFVESLRILFRQSFNVYLQFCRYHCDTKERWPPTTIVTE